jgi:hypothetical protein
MSHRGRSLLVGLVVVLLASFFSMMVATAAEQVTIVGTVNEDYQVVTDDNQVYEIDENEKGDELVQQVNKRVKVTGTVEEDGGQKFIMVSSYQILE